MDANLQHLKRNRDCRVRKRAIVDFSKSDSFFFITGWSFNAGCVAHHENPTHGPSDVLLDVGAPLRCGLMKKYEIRTLLGELRAAFRLVCIVRSALAVEQAASPGFDESRSHSGRRIRNISVIQLFWNRNFLLRKRRARSWIEPIESILHCPVEFGFISFFIFVFECDTLAPPWHQFQGPNWIEPNADADGFHWFVVECDVLPWGWISCDAVLRPVKLEPG